MKVLTFNLWDELFAINITSVKEINRNVICTPTPTAPTEIIGLYNMRGQIVTIFDLAQVLGYKPLPRNKPVNCIILKNRSDMDDIVGFAVDYAEDVMIIDETLCKSPPDNVEESLKEGLFGIFELEKSLLLIIDEKKLFFSFSDKKISF